MLLEINAPWRTKELKDTKETNILFKHSHPDRTVFVSSSRRHFLSFGKRIICIANVVWQNDSSWCSTDWSSCWPLRELLSFAIAATLIKTGHPPRLLAECEWKSPWWKDPSHPRPRHTHWLLLSELLDKNQYVHRFANNSISPLLVA